MSLDDKPAEGEGEEPWNPEDDKLEKRYLKRLVEMMERAFKREDEAAEDKVRHEEMLRSKMSQAARGAAREIAARVPSPHTPGGTPPLIAIRPIENGFILSFLEIVKSSVSPACLPPLPPGMELPPDATVVGSVISFKRVEAFVQDAAGVVPYMERAMKSLREMEKSEA